jgi:spermidine synthase
VSLSRTSTFRDEGNIDSFENEEKKDVSKLESSTNAAADAPPGKLPALVLAVMLSFAVSGAVAMLYEVAWTRTLLMVIGSTTYAFTIMLSTFLLGIFLGSLICSRLVDRISSPIIWFAIVEIVLCFSGIISIYLFNFLPYVNVLAGLHYGKIPELSMLFRFLAAAGIIMPISLCLGFIFPLVVKICAVDLERLGKSIGQLYSVNTVGAIIGAFLAGFLIIPNLGSEQALIFASLANLILGIVLLLAFATQIKPSLKIVYSVLTLLIIVLVCKAPPQIWDYRVIVQAQTGRRTSTAADEDMSYSQWKDKVVGDLLFPFYKEGKSSNVAIVATANNQQHSIYTNGHVDASDHIDMENQAMLAAYPLLLKPKAKNVCIVGWGSGVTAGYALRFPIESMICAEIEPVVIEASKYFHHANFKAEEDKRTSIEPSDGRNFLLGTKQKFDVIISEPSNPWQAGVCNLFTAEYFKICRDSLKDGGIFTMWSQTNEIKDRNLAQVFSALHKSFPYVYIFDTGTDINAIASSTPLKINYEELKQQLAIPELKAALAKFHLQSAEDFIAKIMVCPSGVDAITKDKQPNSDDHNYLEYEVAKTYENMLFHEANLKWLNLNSNGTWNFIDWGKLSDKEKAKEMVKVAEATLRYSPARALAWASESMKVAPNPDALAFIAQLQISNRAFADAGKTLDQGDKQFPDDSRFVGLKGIISLRRGDFVQARKLFEQALRLNPEDSNFRFYLASTYSNALTDDAFSIPAKEVDPEKVIELLGKCTSDTKFIKAKPDLLFVLADAYKESRKLDQAENTAINLLRIAPKGYLNWQLLGEIYMMEGKDKQARYCENKALLLAAPHVFNLCGRISRSLYQKQDEQALECIKKALRISPANEQAISFLQQLSKRNTKAKAYLDSISTDDTILNQGAASSAQK